MNARALLKIAIGNWQEGYAIEVKPGEPLIRYYMASRDGQGEISLIQMGDLPIVMTAVAIGGLSVATGALIAVPIDRALVGYQLTIQFEALNWSSDDERFRIKHDTSPTE